VSCSATTQRTEGTAEMWIAKARAYRMCRENSRHCLVHTYIHTYVHTYIIFYEYKVVYSMIAFRDKERAILLKGSSSNCDVVSIAIIHSVVKSWLWHNMRLQYRNFSKLCHCCTYVCQYCRRVDAWSPRELISACSYPVVINRDRGPVAALQHPVRASIPDSFRVRKL
jgi:hypothetical protein